MSTAAEPLSQHLARVGAASVEDTTRWLLELSALLQRGPGVLDVEVGFISVGPPGSPTLLEPRPLAGDARDQVFKLARVGYECLKGAPPPEGALAAADFIGFRPELARLLSLALARTGAADVGAFAAQLSALRSDTAAYQLNDTVTSQARPAVAADRSGTLLGSYELVRLLGSGGMGEVYLARHTRLGREVAVKVLRPELAALPEVVQRFFQEAKVVNDINHPHIVQIIDFAETPGAVFLVMELLNGRSLARLVHDEGPLPLARIGALMVQVCDAIAAAHARSVVHRDLKPDNLFVTVDPQGREQVKVLDFGIARRLAGADASRTQAGVVMGTPTYMAPEQAAGRPVDARADVYALGVVLYELLDGVSLAGREHQPRALERSAHGEPIPTALRDAVSAALQLEPSARPTVQALRDALEPPEALLKHARPRWRLAVAAAVVAGGAVALWLGAQVGQPQAEGLEASAPGTGDARTGDVHTGDVHTGDARTGNARTAADGTPPVDGSVAAPLQTPDASVRTHRPQGVRFTPLQVKRRFALKHRLQGLVERFGARQLTSIERATVDAALKAPPSEEVEQLLSDAEHALDDAERRLVH